MPVPDPVAFTVFHIDIMWYAILISCGIILATVICCVRAPKHGLTSDHILNFVIICVPAGIIGARLYYVLFHWDWYAGDFFDIINIRAGGLAIHGGLIAGLGTAALLCYFWKIRPLNLLDLAAPSIALAQSIGRWGNYFSPSTPLFSMNPSGASCCSCSCCGWTARPGILAAASKAGSSSPMGCSTLWSASSSKPSALIV